VALGQKLLEVSVRADREVAEALSALFNRYGCGGAVVEERYPTDAAGERALLVKTYLLDDDSLASQRGALQQALWHLGQLYPIPQPEFRILAEEDWAEAWKKHYHPMAIGQRLVLKPTWVEYTPQPGQVVIELDPGMAFGTGQHPSTRLCLVELERRVPPAWRVLDVGTGSGILAIAAAKLGASQVLATDIDPLAVKVALENVRANQVEHVVHVAEGTFGQIGEAWDLVVINILADTIIAVLDEAARRLVSGGLAILSGIIAECEADVVVKMTEVGLSLVKREQEGDWALLVAQR